MKGVLSFSEFLLVEFIDSVHFFGIENNRILFVQIFIRPYSLLFKAFKQFICHICAMKLRHTHGQHFLGFRRLLTHNISVVISSRL